MVDSPASHNYFHQQSSQKVLSLLQPFIKHQHIPYISANSQKTQHRKIFAHPTWVTFSVTLWVRSISLHGAMMSISPVGRAMSGSGLKSTKFNVIWGIFEIVRYRIRSESDVEFKIFDLLLTAPVGMERKRIEKKVMKKETWLFDPKNSHFALNCLICAHLCCYCPAGCLFSCFSVPSQASWPRSHRLRMLAACCGSSPVIGCVTRSSLSLNRLDWGWDGGEVRHREMTGCEGPPGGSYAGEEAEEEVVQHGWGLVRYTGPPGSLQAKAADLTCCGFHLNEQL